MHDEIAKAAERRFQMLTKLMGGGRPTAQELAERFGVEKRTIYRDVAFIEKFVPIIRENGRYWVDDSARIRPIHLQADEVLALVAALDFGQRSRVLGGGAMAAAREKLMAVLPNRQKEIAAGLEQTLVVDPLPGHSHPALPGVEEAIRSALQGPHPVRIAYQALAAEAPSERVIRPYGWAYRGTALYLIAFCELRQDIRTFRANRIMDATVLPATFERPADFNLDAYLGHIWGIEDGPLMHVRLRFYPPAARLAQETRWHPSQEVFPEPGGTVMVTMETRGKNELARWLAGYGGSVEVLGPPELREAVVGLGRAILARNGG